MRREKQAISRVKQRMAVLNSTERLEEMGPPLQNMALKQSTEKYMQDVDQEPIESPKRLYIVGKYKDYRKLVGLEQVKSHMGDPDLNMSQKRRKTLSMQVSPPTCELSLNQTNRKGYMINDAI